MELEVGLPSPWGWEDMLELEDVLSCEELQVVLIGELRGISVSSSKERARGVLRVGVGEREREGEWEGES